MDHKDAELRSWVTFLHDDQLSFDPQVVQWAKKQAIRNVSLGVFEDLVGPPSYKLHRDADVTVLVYVKQKVVANFAFRAGELTDGRIAEVLKPCRGFCRQRRSNGARTKQTPCGRMAGNPRRNLSTVQRPCQTTRTTPAGGRVSGAPPTSPEETISEWCNSTRPGRRSREALLRGLDKTPLDQEVKAHILAQLPSAEEQERMYRDLIENGGLTFEEMCESLGMSPRVPSLQASSQERVVNY